MSKVAKGKARSEKLDAVLKEVLSQDDAGLSRLQKSGMIKKNGMLARKTLADAVGMGTLPDTFRQNKTMKGLIVKAEAKLKQREILIEKEGDTKKNTEVIGKENEERFLSWLLSVGTDTCPAPMNHYGRLYRKALWAQYTVQSILDVKYTPNWFNSRPVVKDALQELNVKVVQGLVVTEKLDSDSIADDMEDSMTSALVRKLRAENKVLKEKLDSEIEKRKDAELEVKQNEILTQQAITGKMAAH